MPGALVKRYELDQPAIAPDEQMRRNTHTGKIGQIRWLPRKEPPTEQALHGGTAKAAGRQADAMDDDQRNRHAGRPTVPEGARPKRRPAKPPAGNIDLHW